MLFILCIDLGFIVLIVAVFVSGFWDVSSARK